MEVELAGWWLTLFIFVAILYDDQRNLGMRGWSSFCIMSVTPDWHSIMASYGDAWLASSPDGGRRNVEAPENCVPPLGLKDRIHLDCSWWRELALGLDALLG